MQNGKFSDFFLQDSHATACCANMKQCRSCLCGVTGAGSLQPLLYNGLLSLCTKCRTQQYSITELIFAHCSRGSEHSSFLAFCAAVRSAPSLTMWLSLLLPVFDIKALLLFLVAFLLVTDYLKNRNPPCFPPGPWALPFLGNVFNIDIKQPHIYLTEVSKSLVYSV